MEKNDPNSVLAPFLRKLADDLDGQQLSPEETQRVGEFYAAWTFHSTPENPDETDLMKFFTMGWYVYRQLLKNETLK